MITLRKSHERGAAEHGWLSSRHSFSFAEYHDANHMGFRDLRVINEDWVEPSQGFGTHPHRDMEIVTYVLEGALQHRDSMGNGSLIRPGEVQRMSAGSGITHSEFNASKQDKVHLLQIWIMPAKRGITPSYEQKEFSAAERQGKLRLVASPDGREGSVTIHQDAAIYASLLGKGERAGLQIRPGRHAWVQVARGEVRLNGQLLQAGDGAALSDERALELQAESASEVLVFDLN